MTCKNSSIALVEAFSDVLNQHVLLHCTRWYILHGVMEPGSINRASVLYPGTYVVCELKVVILSSSFGVHKGQSSSLLAATCRYSLSYGTGHIANFHQLLFKVYSEYLQVSHLNHL